MFNKIIHNCSKKIISELKSKDEDYSQHNFNLKKRKKMLLIHHFNGKILFDNPKDKVWGC